MTREHMRGLAQARLEVLNALPRRHQDYFFQEVRAMCSSYVASLGISISDRPSEASLLFSEVMTKLVVPAGLETDDAGAGDRGDALQIWKTDEDPRRDERVAWLISQVGGRRALAHRSENIRRDLYGRWKGDGYPVDQLEDLHTDGIAVDPEDPHHERDIRWAWLGLLAAAKSEFKQPDDVPSLLYVLATDPEIEADFGSEWPIGKIVIALNQLYPDPPWNDARVDNAKRRLQNWIKRMKRGYGLDSTELMDLFARRARMQEQQAADSPVSSCQPSPSNALPVTEAGHV